MQLLIVMLLSSMLSQAITWTTKEPLPQVRSAPGCAVINDTVYVIGGSSGGASIHNTNYVYDPVNDNWSTKSPMPTARSQLSCAVVDGKIYAIGGWISGNPTNLVEEYDPVSDSWSTKTPMPTARYAFGIAVVANKIYVIGGMFPVRDIVEEYDPVADSWSTKTSMPTRRMGPGCTVINDTIYVFGGSYNIGSKDTLVNECYDPVTDNWETKAPMSFNRYAHGSFSYNNKAYSVGGYDYSSYFTTVEVYDPIINSWSYETSMQYARQSIAVGLVGNKVYVIGGWNNGALNYNDEGTLPVGVEEQQAVQKMGIEIGPNPFTETTVISVQCPVPRCRSNLPVAICIYDLSGRLVKTFSLTTDHSALTTAFSWDGKSNNGTPLPSGTYFLVVNNQGISERRVLNLIR